MNMMEETPIMIMMELMLRTIISSMSVKPLGFGRCREISKCSVVVIIETLLGETGEIANGMLPVVRIRPGCADLYLSLVGIGRGDETIAGVTIPIHGDEGPFGGKFLIYIETREIGPIECTQVFDLALQDLSDAGVITGEFNIIKSLSKKPQGSGDDEGQQASGHHDLY